MPRTPEEILDALNEDGEMPTESEVGELCTAAIAGDWALEHLEALQHALEQAGWAVMNLTTDDDDGTVLELVPPEAAA